MMKNLLKKHCRLVSLITYLSIALIATASAQVNLNQEDNKNFDELIYIEVDPFAYINKGYSIHLGYENWGFRFDLTKVKVDFPEAFEDAFYSTKAFDLVSNINGIKIQCWP